MTYEWDNSVWQSRYMHTPLLFYFHATVSVDLFFLPSSLEGLHRPASSTLHTMYTPLSLFTLTHHLCIAVPFPHFLVSHFIFPISHFPFLLSEWPIITGLEYWNWLLEWTTGTDWWTELLWLLQDSLTCKTASSFRSICNSIYLTAQSHILS